MATVGIKRFIVNNETIQTKTGTAEYKQSGGTKEAVLDDGSGAVMFFTQERTAGMFKVQVSTLKEADTDRFRTIEDAEIVLELLDGKTLIGTNCTQTADNSATAADGTVEYEFHGNVSVS